MTSYTREDALSRLAELRETYRMGPKQLADLNEASTRLLLVDEILSLLGWDKSEFHPETDAGKAGFTDYLLKLDSHPRVVVEAKRAGHTFCSTKSHTKIEYKLSYVRSAFGTRFTEVLEQSERSRLGYRLPSLRMELSGY